MNNQSQDLFTSSPRMAKDITLETYIRDWNLTDAEKKHLTGHFLREWSLLELVDKLELNSDTGLMEVILWKTHYLPVFQGDQTEWDKLAYMAVRGKVDIDPMNDKVPNFWLSFRSGIVEGEKFNYVIIQKDKKI